jgi:hypothetical protein
MIMEKKETQMMEFVNKVNLLKEEMLNENIGCLLFTYEKKDEGQDSGFTATGNFANLAECLYTCMNKDQGLANIIIAASNAFVQRRVAAMQAEMQAAETAETPKKKRRTKKAN